LSVGLLLDHRYIGAQHTAGNGLRSAVRNTAPNTTWSGAGRMP